MPMAIPMLHQTDLFRPHEDPDDHWDLACVYALAVRGAIDLAGILIDHPPRGGPREYGDPDIGAVAQLNHLTGLQVPCVVGSSIPVRFRGDSQEDAPRTDRGGVAFVLRALREAARPLAINVVGSCRDIALAINAAPALFADKCAAIYLNAGNGDPDPAPGATLEYNVALNPAAYGALFAAPCPVYWMPCFAGVAGDYTVGEFGTWYRFRQGDVLTHLSSPLRRYFASMLTRACDAAWLRHLEEADGEALSARLDEGRNMWCTAGFLHAAGYAVARDGSIAPRGDIGDAGVFAFEPITVTCDERGVTRWFHSNGADKRFIFHVVDTNAYPVAMTRALETLLRCL